MSAEKERTEKTYLITGGTGFLGCLLTQELLRTTKDRIILPVRSLEKARQLYSQCDGNRLVMVETDLEHLHEGLFPGTMDYVIHAAATTTSRVMVEKPVEVMSAMTEGTRRVLEVARAKQVQGMVYLSSMEAYGSVPDDGRRRTEEETGYISLTAARSCYPLGKQAAELLCALYAREYHVPVVVARLSQVFGKGSRPDDQRVFMQFARAVKEERDIVLKTDGMSVGNYTASEDAVAAILFLLRNGAVGETYNIVNEENTMRIREMAQLVADHFTGGKIAVRVEPTEGTAYAAPTGLRLSGEKLRRLGFVPSKSVIEMYQDLLDTLEASKEGL